MGARDLLGHGVKDQAALAPEGSTSSFAAQRRAPGRLALKTFLSILLTIPVLILAWLPLSDSVVLKNSVSLFSASLPQILVAFSSIQVCIYLFLETISQMLMFLSHLAPPLPTFSPLLLLDTKSLGSRLEVACSSRQVPC